MQWITSLHALGSIPESGPFNLIGVIMDSIKHALATLDMWDYVIMFFVACAFIAINWAWSDSKRDVEDMYRSANGYGEY